MPRQGAVAGGSRRAQALVANAHEALVAAAPVRLDAFAYPRPSMRPRCRTLSSAVRGEGWMTGPMVAVASLPPALQRGKRRRVDDGADSWAEHDGPAGAEGSSGGGANSGEVGNADRRLVGRFMSMYGTNIFLSY